LVSQQKFFRIMFGQFVNGCPELHLAKNLFFWCL